MEAPALRVCTGPSGSVPLRLRSLRRPAVSHPLSASGASVAGPLLASVLALLSLAGPTPAPAQTVTFPSNAVVHDPSFVQQDDTFYVFGSHLAAARTEDLQYWTQFSTDAGAGNSLIPDVATQMAAAFAWSSTNTFWAPDVIQLSDGQFYMYWCMSRSDAPRASLGLATAEIPEGPFTNEGTLLQSGMTGTSPDGTTYDPTVHPNTVDPDVFFDASGRLWMVYGSYSGGIFLVELDPATGLLLPNQGYGRRLIGGNHSRIEAPCILYHPDTGYYYLFLSFGGFAANGGYNIRVGRALTPEGPFLDAAGTDLTTVKGATGTVFDDASIAPHGVKLIGNYQFLATAGEPQTTSRGYVSPGHNSAWRDSVTGDAFIVFHTRFVGQGEVHEVRVHSLLFNTAGWPLIAPHRFAGETLTPIAPGAVPGTFKLIDHGRDISATVKTSTLLTLQADGTVTGSATGRWELIGEHDLQLTLGGTVHQGVFLRQWDDDQGVWVLAFTALSPTGTALWGSKVAAATSLPALAPIDDQVVALGGTLQLTVSGVATGSQTLVYSVASGPTGLTVDASTGALTWTPTSTQAGLTHNVTVRVQDSTQSTLRAERSFAIAAHGAPQLEPLVDELNLRPGAALALSVDAFGSGPFTYQWRFQGQPIANATDATYTVAAVTTAHAGLYDVQVTNTHGTTTSEAVDVFIAPSARLFNLSARVRTGPGDDVLIAGTVITGTRPKQLLITGLGPVLGTVGVAGALTTTRLKFYSGDTLIAQNQDWATNPDAAAIQAKLDGMGAARMRTGSADSALLVTVAPGGGYTIHLDGGTGNAAGVGLIEVYEADGDTSRSRLLNLSARARVGTGDDLLIPGLIVSGSTPRKLLIHAVGPALEPAGVQGFLADPFMELRSQPAGTLITSNDNGGDDPAVRAAATAIGATPLGVGKKDAGLLVTVPPGGYTILVRGVNNTTGICVVEVFDVTEAVP